jgi:hypothetical protein
LVEGVSAGIFVGFIALLLFPFAGEPSVAAMGVEDFVIWLGVLAAVGSVNALFVFALASFLLHWRREEV